jgi:predicted aldo/keto reductase-like oxidoreductase
MEFRSLPRGNERISTLGLGGEYLEGLPAKEVVDIVDYAIENGVNIVDVFMPGADVRSNIGIALEGRRNKMYIQGHLCTVRQDGQYKRSRNLEQVKVSYDDLLTRLKTDYIDFGMIHYVDKEEDFQEIISNGIYDYMKDLKRQGVIKHMGFSSHNPVIARKFIETCDVDILMFSINPAYDLDPTDSGDINAFLSCQGMKNEGAGTSPLRSGLYALCEKQGIGITVMKTLAAGRLLSAANSPFGEALTVPQCMHYSLTRPAVLSCMMGVHTLDELKECLKYYTVSDEEKDYTAIARSPKYAMTGKCMYCNHCLPCPSNIDIATVNKFLDIATMEETLPVTVKEHYRLLDASADDCIQCGTCEKNCPFGVDIRAKMRKAVEVFK